ncbi:disulfide bond formation protein B [Legionella impletisoli]|uniref:Disulfide bond formation protein B n=1 Tax=Legionella impletisoli TaxID=343510 RepID=A0A917JYL5_9GAMM|nr:disulfide bond formation protein B [Legionella impletisoli]GGI89144.1 disulfide bond formation protein B 1 [Legionella impletisoli]
MTKRIYRVSQSFLFFLTFFIVFMSFYFQYVLGMIPCPLCIMQRICAMILGLFCLMGMSLSTLKRARLVAVFQMIFSLAGTYFAGRQVWLQSLPPDKAPACMPGLDVMLEYFPWQDIAHAFIWGAGDCAEQHWHWFGFSMAMWSLFYFIFMFLASAIIFFILKQTLSRVIRT